MRLATLMFYLCLPVAAALAGDDDAKEKKPMDLKAIIKTEKGDITLELFPEEAPLTVMNFVNLAQRGYYDGLKFHRVIKDPPFMIQGGDPTGSGSGGPGYKFKDEFSPKHRFDSAGVLAMANSGPRTNGSQFFITHKDTSWLNNKHTIFGKVLKGQDVVNAVEQGDQMKEVIIEGDPSELFAAHKEQLDQWNKILDKKFPRKEKAGKSE